MPAAGSPLRPCAAPPSRLARSPGVVGAAVRSAVARAAAVEGAGAGPQVDVGEQVGVGAWKGGTQGKGGGSGVEGRRQAPGTSLGRQAGNTPPAQAPSSSEQASGASCPRPAPLAAGEMRGASGAGRPPARWQSKLRSVAPPLAYTVSSANWSSDTSCTQGRSMKKLRCREFVFLYLVGQGGVGRGREACLLPYVPAAIATPHRPRALHALCA